MAACDYWNAKFDGPSGMYNCPWCPKQLKPTVSKSAKNPGKVFVSCNKDYGGCGLFSFIDKEPNDKFKPNGTKRERSESAGTNLVGPVAKRPDVLEIRLGELATEVSELRSRLVESLAKIDEIHTYVKEVTDH